MEVLTTTGMLRALLLVTTLFAVVLTTIITGMDRVLLLITTTLTVVPMGTGEVMIPLPVPMEVTVVLMGTTTGMDRALLLATTTLTVVLMGIGEVMILTRLSMEVTVVLITIGMWKAPLLSKMTITGYNKTKMSSTTVSSELSYLVVNYYYFIFTMTIKHSLIFFSFLFILVFGE